MKTNKQEREAIAAKFYKKMSDRMVEKNEEFQKTSTYKELSKLKAEKLKLNKESVKLEEAIQKKMNSFNNSNPSDYCKLNHDYNYRHEDSDFKIVLESMWSCQTDLTNAILIAQVGVETVDEMFEYLEKEVAI